MSVVFTDAFTVGADANIDAHPSGSPDYEYVRNSGSALVVQASTDRVAINAVDTNSAARITDGAAPTGNQEITASILSTTDGDSGFVIGRASAPAGGQNYYSVFLYHPDANEVAVYRRDNGVSTLIANETRGLSAGTHTLRFKVTGTNPVELELQIDATAVVSYSDSHADRKQSGTPGLGGYSSTGGTVWVDNVSVDDLAVVGGVVGSLVVGKLLERGALVV